ncbi:MAG: hypothetical protein JXR91_09460 [Deltaproteobacteria bacterium]|nr:hypothetical protein [Deltaproteobacteria bacterium]
MTTSPVSEEIDFVYTWVDGEKNAALREQFAAAQINSEAGDKANVTSRDINILNRFRDNREIIQSINSVHRFAPFVRKIFIVAAEGQVPDWYNSNDYPDVEMVFHPELFGVEYADMLPTFNSHSIEAMLPFIPGLSERFVYFNDDMFLGAPVTSEDFFDPDGTAIVRIRGEVEAFWQTHKKAWRNYRGNLYGHLKKQFPGISVYDTAHQCRTLLKSSCLNAWKNREFKDLLICTAKDKFRDLSNIPPIELFSNMILIEKKARIVRQQDVVIQLFDRSVLGPEFCALKNLQPRFYCINDDMCTPSPGHLNRLQRYLSHHLPHHLNDSSRPGSRFQPARPKLGAVISQIAHTVSWCNRMLGAMLDKIFS